METPRSAATRRRVLPPQAKPGESRGTRKRAPAAQACETPAQRLFRITWTYLGGRKFSHLPLCSKSDVHAAILRGVPYAALIFLFDQAKALDDGDLAKVLAISTRTLRRQSETPDKPMPADLASKTWLLAETLARAADVFGSKEEAERWMSRPAMGLDGQRPIELLQTMQGAELVNDFLGRLEYGVYA